MKIPKMKLKKNYCIGVLALQGDFLEHIAALKKLDASAKEVRSKADLKGIDALIIPGGETTVMADLMQRFQLRAPIIKLAKNGLPVWGTCAGMIMLAKKIKENYPKPLGLMDITVERNAYGRQVDSFEKSITVRALGPKSFPAVFIRAPKISSIKTSVEILSTADGSPVAIRQKNFLATSFHPELSNDLRFHKYFLTMI